MHNKVLALIFALIITGYLQSSGSDSIKKLLDASWLFYNNGKLDSSLRYASEALKLSEELNNDTFIGHSNVMLGNIFVKKGEYKSAIQYYTYAQNIFERIQFKKALAKTYNNLGIAYEKIGAFASSIFFYHRAYRINQESGDTGALIINLLNIASSLADKGYSDIAIGFLNKILGLIDTAKNADILSKVILNKGVAMQEKHLYDSALYFYRKSLDIASHNNDYLMTTLALLNIAISYEKMHLLDSAFKYINKAIKTSKRIDNIEIGALLAYHHARILKERHNCKASMEILNGNLSLPLLARNFTLLAKYYLLICECLLKRSNLKAVSDTLENIYKISAVIEDPYTLIETIRIKALIDSLRGDTHSYDSLMQRYATMRDSITYYQDSTIKSLFESEKSIKRDSVTAGPTPGSSTNVSPPPSSFRPSSIFKYTLLVAILIALMLPLILWLKRKNK